MCAFLRAAPKRQAEDKGGEEKRSQNRGEKGRRSNAKKTLENDLYGKCSKEGYIKNNSIKILSYSSGLVHDNKVIFEVMFE